MVCCVFCLVVVLPVGDEMLPTLSTWHANVADGLGQTRCPSASPEAGLAKGGLSLNKML